MAKPTIWKKLGAVSSRELVDARLQLHWAAQTVASVGNALLAARADDSQSNLGWMEQHGALASHSIPGDFHAALRLADLTLLLLDDRKAIAAQHSLNGSTLDQAFAWLMAGLHKVAGVAPSTTLSLRDYEMPEHPVGQGARFSLENQRAFEELSCWFANAHHAFEEVQKEPFSTAGSQKEPLQENTGQATDVRCWPHHFDIATLLVLDPQKEPGSARSIGVGLSPGDATFSEPYIYVNPWPRPESSEMPSLAGGGIWHTQDFFGAVLVGSEVLTETSAEHQAEKTRQFLRSAVEADTQLLGA